MILKHCTDHKSAYAYAHAHAHIPIYWNLQKYCNACSAQSFRRSYTSVRLEHRNTTELETHTLRARVIEGERERERPIGLCLSLYRVDLLASCNELSERVHVVAVAQHKERNSLWSSLWLTLSRPEVGTFCWIASILIFKIIQNIKFWFYIL